MLNIFDSFILITLITVSAQAAPQRDFSNSPSYQQALNTQYYGYDDRQKLNRILAHYAEWKGVSYKLGGNSRQGIDCSAYMQRVFRDGFSFSLPRSSHEQIKLGSRIAISDLNTGDLIFFKTSSQERHVGVYIGEGEFIHASSSVGVTVSKLGSKYWKKRYDQARRINNIDV